MKKKATKKGKASRKRSAAKDLTARKSAKGGILRAGGGPHVKAFSGQG